MKFQRGDLVRITWFEINNDWKKVKGPAIVIEARTKNWIKVWIPARNETMVTTGFFLRHYDETRIK